MVVAALSADLAASLGDAERAADLYELLSPFADTNVVIGLGALCVGSTQRYLGRLALTLGRRADAIEHLREAVQANTDLRAVVEVAHSRIDLARALGRGSESRELLDRAETTAAELRAPRWWRGGRPSCAIAEAARPPPGDACSGRYPRRPMPKTLVIAEKPSVGRDLVRVLPGAFTKQGKARSTWRGPSTWSPGRSATSCSSPTPTSTTTSTRSGGWPICRSCPSASSWSCATNGPRSR